MQKAVALIEISRANQQRWLSVVVVVVVDDGGRSTKKGVSVNDSIEFVMLSQVTSITRHTLVAPNINHSTVALSLKNATEDMVISEILMINHKKPINVHRG